MTLTFSAEGKLLDGYLPRFNPEYVEGNCAENDFLSIRVLLPVDYLNKEKKAIDKMVADVNKAMSDTKSTLHVILKCGLKENFYSATKAFSRDIHNWDTSHSVKFFPKELIEYYEFIESLQKSTQLIKTKKPEGTFKKDKEEASVDITDDLPAVFKKYLPFSLKLKGIEIDTSCIRFEKLAVNDECECFQKNSKNYLAVIFKIPPGFVTKNIAADSFQLIRKFQMKEVAISWYNTLLAAYKTDILKFKNLQQLTKASLDTISYLILSLDSLQALDVCTKDQRNLKVLITQKICKYKKVVDSIFNDFNCSADCGENTKNQTNALLCSPVLSQWLLRLIWLNGDLIRLNPFNFTTSKNITAQNLATKKGGAAKDRDRKNAEIQLIFWDAAIANLRDSIMLSRRFDIDSGNKLLTKLLKIRDSVVQIISNNPIPESKDETTENLDKYRGFITTSQVNYKGWLIPYKSSEEPDAYTPDKIWLRNYYLDQVPNPLRNKHHFTYPEDENVTLLLHNIPAGSGMLVTESVKPFADSAAFTLMAGEAIAQAASLYASLAPIVPIVKKLIHDVTSISVKNGENVIPISINDGKINKAEVQKLMTSKTSVLIISDGRSSKPFSSKEYEDAIIRYNKNFDDDNSCIVNIDSCYINYIKSLYSIATSPSLIDEELEAREDTAALYYTGQYQLSSQEAPYKMEYKLSAFKTKPENATTIDSSYINVGRYRYLQLAAGIGYSPRAGSVTSVDTTGGQFKINRDEDLARLIVGIRWYPWGLYNQKGPASLLYDGRWKHRLSILAATGIPKPLQNLYLGVGTDPVPGLTLSTGVHFQQQNRFNISNNQVKDRSIGYHGYWFFSVTVDPSLLVSAITSLF